MAECTRELDCSDGVQFVRLVDVLALGPAMIAVGYRRADLLGLFVATAGMVTIAFNGDRYLRARARRRSATL